MVTQIPADTPVISPTALVDALSALGTFDQAPTAAQLAEAELAEGREALVARLSNALYGSALAHVMTAEIAASAAGVDTGYRAEAWRAAGADGEGEGILLHYTAMRLSADLRTISERLPVDLGVMAAAAGAAAALTLLLEVCTVRSMDDPRAEAVTTNLARAADQLGIAADHIGTLFAAARTVSDIVAHEQ
jgi:hypothetical protein